MGYSTVAGPFHEDPEETDFEPELPIGIVVADFADAAEYILASPRGLPTPYYIIRTAADVPARLGGVALLSGAPLGDELTAALTAALLPPVGSD